MRKSSRRRFTFSIASLMLLTAALAGILSIVGAQIRQYRTEAAAAADLQSHGAHVYWDGWRVSSVGILGIPMSREIGTALHRLRNGDALHVYCPQPLPQGQRHCFSAFEHITYLQFTGAGVTDEDLRGIAQLTKLDTLQLNGTAITDKGLSLLHEINTLRKIELYETRVTRGGVQQLRRALPNAVIGWNEEVLLEDM